MLDLTRYIASPYCTKLFADYGGDVIKIEQQGSGDPIRHVPPFYDDVPDAEASLHFLYLNTNKRSITLDLKSERGQQLFLELARTADLVVENFRPGVLDRLGIGWETLQDVNPPSRPRLDLEFRADGSVPRSSRERAFYEMVDHAEGTGVGRRPVIGRGYRLSRTPPRIDRPALPLGEANEYVFKELLGMSDERFDQLSADAIIGRLEPLDEPETGMSVEDLLRLGTLRIHDADYRKRLGLEREEGLPD